jgi:hypothetical protein
LGRETTNDIVYNRMARILPRSILELACTGKILGAARTPQTTESPRFMNRWGINRKLAHRVAWSTSMAKAEYGIEAIWAGQNYIVQLFHKLTAWIKR